MAMNIIISVNEKYIEPAKTMLFSLRAHTQDEITVWNLNHSVREEKVQELTEYLQKKCHITMQTINVGDSVFDGMSLGLPGLFSIEIYYRILAPWLLPETVDRAAWLDADMIIRASLEDFYYQDFQGKSIVACEDGRSVSGIDDSERLGVSKNHRYFNSGVLLMNFTQIREKFTPAVIGAYKDKELIYPDQDILNCMFENDLLYADYKRYNCNAHVFSALPDKKNVVILHYYGTNKPWEYRQGFDPDLEYHKVKKQQGVFMLAPYHSQISYMKKCFITKCPVGKMLYRLLKGKKQ